MINGRNVHYYIILLAIYVIFFLNLHKSVFHENGSLSFMSIVGQRDSLFKYSVHFRNRFHVAHSPCLGYVNAYIWTPNCHVMQIKPALCLEYGAAYSKCTSRKNAKARNLSHLTHSLIYFFLQEVGEKQEIFSCVEAPASLCVNITAGFATKT